MIKVMYWFGLCLVLLSCFVWGQWPDGNMRLTMCDVGQGDAFILSHNFSQWLIDTGSSNGSVEACLGSVMPFWDRSIEVILITHADEDHSGAFQSLIRRYNVDKVVTTSEVISSLAYEGVDRLKVEVVKGGDLLAWEGVQAEVLWPISLNTNPKNTNNASIVLRMEYQHTSIWFAGDVDEKIEKHMIDSGLVKQSTVLKVAHHGSKTATMEAFLAILQPRQAWISVGRDNRYGHPDQSLVDRLMHGGVEVYRSDETGHHTLVLD